MSYLLVLFSLSHAFADILTITKEAFLEETQIKEGPYVRSPDKEDPWDEKCWEGDLQVIENNGRISIMLAGRPLISGLSLGKETFEQELVNPDSGKCTSIRTSDYVMHMAFSTNSKKDCRGKIQSVTRRLTPQDIGNIMFQITQSKNDTETKTHCSIVLKE